MPDYIDRDALLAQLNLQAKNDYNANINKIVMSMPSAPVEPMRQVGTEMKLIDADALKLAFEICDVCKECPSTSAWCAYECTEPALLTPGIERVIDAQPIVDAKPITHGQWKPTQFPFMNECADCSICGYRTVWGVNHKFCPACGAKMDLEEEK